MTSSINQYPQYNPRDRYQQNNNFNGSADVAKQTALKAQESAQDSIPGQFASDFVPKDRKDLVKSTISFIIAYLGLKGISTAVKKSMEGNLQTQRMGKIVNALDTFSEKATKNKFINNSFTQRISRHLGKGTQSIKNIINKIFVVPTKPKLGFVQSAMRGTYGEALDDFANAIQHLDDAGKGKLRDLGISNIDDLISGLKGNTTTGEQVFAQIKGKLPNLGEKVTVVLNKGPMGKIFARKIDLKQSFNVLTRLQKYGQSGARTHLGDLAAKGIIRSAEAMSNGVVGGPLALLFGAMIYTGIIKKTLNAPKGEKVSTFAEEVTQDVGFYVSMPFIGHLFHKFTGGLKYTGFGKTAEEKIANVGTYRTAIKTLESKLKDGLIIDKNIYKKEANAIKELAKQNLKWWQKPFRFIGNILGGRLEAIPQFTVKGQTARNILKRIIPTLKGFGFGAGRLIIVMMLTSAFVNQIVKISHKIFGRPTKSLLDDEDKNKKATAEKTNAPATQNAINNVFKPNSTATTATAPANNVFINDYIKNRAQTPIAAKSLNTKEEKEPPRSYIPSSEPVPYTKEENNNPTEEKLNVAFAKADKYIEYAEEQLKKK